MSPILFGICAVTVGLALAGGALAWRPDGALVRVRSNLGAGLDVAAPAETVATPGLVERFARVVTPGAVVRRLEHRYSLAGRPRSWTIPTLLALKLVTAGAGVIVALVWANAKPGALSVLLGGVVVVVAYFGPDLLLTSRGQERQAVIGAELPDTLDQMSIAVAAGLSFESAMMRSAKNGKGPLAEELGRTLQDMHLGMSRREAYLALAERTDVPDLRRFLRAVIQADAYGVAITEVLRTQAGEMRVKRRQRAETKAMQIPVKVIFPLMFCILPTLFIVLLGPAVLNMIETFSTP